MMNCLPFRKMRPAELPDPSLFAFRMLTMKKYYILKQDNVFVVTIWMNKDVLPCFEQIMTIGFNFDAFIGLHSIETAIRLALLPLFPIYFLKVFLPYYLV